MVWAEMVRPFTARNLYADRGRFVNYTRKGNTIYFHVHYWPGDTPAERVAEVLSAADRDRYGRPPD